MRKHHMCAFLGSLLMIALAVPAWAQQTVFKEVWVRYNRSEEARRMVEKGADLVLDDASRRLIVKSRQKPLDINYDDVQKMIFEVTTHVGGGAGAFGSLFGAVGGAVDAARAAKRAVHYWCYFEYKKPDGGTEPYLLKIHKGSSQQVVEKLKSIFGERVAIAEFPKEAEEIDKELLKERESKHSLKLDKKKHPTPEIKADKALVVVVCPSANSNKQVKIHANDQVVAVNRAGGYSFFYLDPGEYLLVSQGRANASGMRINLAAGKDYYFLQNSLMGWTLKTKLSRHTKELVMYELNGSHYSDWKRK